MDGNTLLQRKNSHPEALDDQWFPCPALLPFVICFGCKQGSGLKEAEYRRNGWTDAQIPTVFFRTSSSMSPLPKKERNKKPRPRKGQRYPCPAEQWIHLFIHPLAGYLQLLLGQIKPNIGKLAILRGTYRLTNIWTDRNMNFLLCSKGHCPLLGLLAKRE